MRARTLLLGTILVAAAAAAVVVGRRARHAHTYGGGHRHATDREADAAQCGWATCSAPSARAYDLASHWLLGGLYRRMADDLAATIAGYPSAAVLEIGPGPGVMATELARRVDDLRLTGVDIDPAMVERAASRARREGLGDRLSFVAGDVAALPFPDASFDLVTSSFSVHHWPDAAAGFAEIRRVLRPGGRAIVYDLPDRWGAIERHAMPLGAAAAAGGFTGALATPFRWPGPLSVTQRLEMLQDG